MIDQHRGGQGQGICLVERVSLEEFEMSLLAALPLGDSLERADIPADQLGERGRSWLHSDTGRWVFECNFTVPRPARFRALIVAILLSEVSSYFMTPLRYLGNR